MWKTVKRFLSWLLPSKDEPPDDPYSYRPAPVRRDPPDRNSAIAVMEPDEDD
jgi:hypothetical protein